MSEPTSLPASVVSLADHEALARQRLPADRWAYLCGAAGDGITAEQNTRAWTSIGLRPRVLRALAGGHTRVHLLGKEWAHPVLVAPMAYQRLAHAQGEAATALAAAVMGAGMVLSTQSSIPMEDVARLSRDEPGRGPLWFQLYLQHDRDWTVRLIRRAEAAGFEALVLTVDAPVHGVRDAERRTGFRLPPEVEAVHLRDLRSRAHVAPGPGQSALFDGLLTSAPTWDDIGWLRSQTRLPVLLKGITHPDDARLAVQHGAAGVIVSNHGGRTLDTAAPTARVLPGVVGAVGNTVPVIVDGGIRRGTDILKAMSLGASAVLVGRPVLHGLINDGATGVAHVLRLLRDELEIAMALTGCRTLADAHPGLLWQAEEKFQHFS